MHSLLFFGTIITIVHEAHNKYKQAKKIKHNTVIQSLYTEMSYSLTDVICANSTVRQN